MSGFKIIKRADIILIAAIVVAGIWLSAVLILGKSEGQTLRVTVDGKLYGTYNTSIDSTVTVSNGEDLNTFEIKNGRVDMVNANCPGFDCVHEHSIGKHGETIVCLPHKVVLEITGNEKEVDAVAR